MANFYVPSGHPVTKDKGRSSTIRAEFLRVAAAMQKLAPYTGNANKFVIIDPDGTSYTATAALLASQIPNLDVSKINAGVLDAGRIPNLDAAKIATGQFVAARIPSLPGSKITGSLTTAQVPSLPATKIGSGDLTRPWKGSGTKKITKITVQTTDPTTAGTIDGELVLQY